MKIGLLVSPSPLKLEESCAGSPVAGEGILAVRPPEC
jgi:hypothetical protein